jgi:cytosine/adenosine deaminase-related metal-dependent hydrolase
MTLAVEGGRDIFSLTSGIEAGVVADLAVFPFAADTLDTFFDPVRQLVYGAQSRARHVLIESEPVVLDGTIIAFDEPALQAELRELREILVPNQGR